MTKHTVEEIKQAFMNYKVEDLFVLNNLEDESKHFAPKFLYEDELTVIDKVEIMDEHSNGLVSYLVGLFNKYMDEEADLPQQGGKVRTGSRKAWIRRNDTRKALTAEGKLYLFGNAYNGIENPRKDYLVTHKPYSNDPYHNRSILQSWFYSFIVQRSKEEYMYHIENDPIEIKRRKLGDLGHRHSEVFNCMELNDIVWNSKSDVPEERLDIYLQLYEALEGSIKYLSDTLVNLDGYEAILGEEEE